MAISSADKRAWHDQMRDRACEYAGQRCMQCKKITPVHQGVIHHTSYPVGVYERNVEDLIEQGICLWLCHSCHEAAHLAKTEEETRGSVKNAGVCYHCGKVAYGGWDRAHSLGLDYPICRECHCAIVQRQRAENAGQIGLFGDIDH